MSHPKEEKTLVLVKPDGVKRGLIGEVIKRVEQRGLKIIAMKMLIPTDEIARNHYPNSDEWMTIIGDKTYEHYNNLGKDPATELGTGDKLEIGRLVAGWNIDFLKSSPVVAMVVEGIHAIAMIRKIVGATFPSKAEMGTIRGDYSVDSPTLANTDKRTIHNLVHASGDEKEAAHEIKLWFTPEEIHSYKRAEEDVMF
jgi:nucleoside-diphosphate kinase